MKELVVVTNDRVGLLADITGALAKKGINIEGIDVNATGKKAVCRVTVEKNDERTARAALSKAGFKVLDSDMLVVKIANRPGELSALARKLADRGISITNVHLLGKSGESVLCALEADNKKLAHELLGEYLE